MTPRHRITFGYRAIMLLVCIMTLATTSFNRALRMPRADVKFARDAMGRPAARDAEWRVTLRSARTGSVGTIAAAALCRDEAFLLDARLSVVRRIDLTSGRQTSEFGSSGAAPDAPKNPRAMALDCAGRRIYVIDGTGVFVYDLASELAVRHILKPENFVYAGGNALLDGPNDLLFVPGIWPAARHDWLSKSLDRMFEGDRLGYRLSLRDGTTSPLFAPVERGCWAFTSDCLNAVFDRVPESGGGAAWVAAQSVSTQVGIFDSQYRLQRTFDVRSPRFLESGERTSRSDGIVTEVKWHETNSVIRRVYAFNDRIVTIHTTNATRNWTPGHQIDFDVYMNIHSLDGSGLVSDIRLPDLPVARDDRNLYVVDYGSGGRRINTQNVTLVRVPIAN